MVSESLRFLLDPSLPSEVLAFFGAIATLIVVFSIGVWSVIGACRVFRALLNMDKPKASG